MDSDFECTFLWGHLLALFRRFDLQEVFDRFLELQGDVANGDVLTTTSALIRRTLPDQSYAFRWLIPSPLRPRFNQTT
jgi:hypothetical protein